MLVYTTDSVILKELDDGTYVVGFYSANTKEIEVEKKFINRDDADSFAVEYALFKGSRSFIVEDSSTPENSFLVASIEQDQPTD